jgi:transforming growth factor-beta-induced protein
MSVLGAVGARIGRPALLVGAMVIATGAVLAQGSGGRTVVDVVSTDARFSTLAKAATAAELIEPLGGEGPITVFAPTDSAFAKVDKATLESLLKPENRDRLRGVLTYHVVPGRLTGADLVSRSGATTLNGQLVGFTFVDGTLRVNGARVTQIDVNTSNGVVHVIDGVLIPPVAEAAAEPAPISSGAMAALELIDRAIRRGVPLFNEGQVEACLAVYGITCRALIGLGANDIPAEVVRDIKGAIDEANNEHDPSEQAWILRRALDRASETLSGQRLMPEQGATRGTARRRG